MKKKVLKILLLVFLSLFTMCIGIFISGIFGLLIYGGYDSELFGWELFQTFLITTCAGLILMKKK